MSDELKQELHEWIYKTGCNKKFPVYFHDYPEVNEGLDLLIKIHDAWDTRAEHRCDQCKHYIPKPHWGSPGAEVGRCKNIEKYLIVSDETCVDSDFYCKHFERKEDE